MTRGTIKEFFMGIENAPDHSNRWKPELVCEIIDTIFDDFESRTCENCKHYNGVSSYTGKPYCTKHHDSWSKGEMYEFDMGKDFGCNKWEQK